MRILRYSLWRLLILLAVVGALYLVGMRSWLLGVTAVVVAALVSYLVLPDSRLGAARQLQERDPMRARPTRTGHAAQDADDEDQEIDTGTR